MARAQDRALEIFFGLVKVCSRVFDGGLGHAIGPQTVFQRGAGDEFAFCQAFQPTVFVLGMFHLCRCV